MAFYAFLGNDSAQLEAVFIFENRFFTFQNRFMRPPSHYDIFESVLILNSKNEKPSTWDYQVKGF
jgi:hypothetical protein